MNLPQTSPSNKITVFWDTYIQGTNDFVRKWGQKGTRNRFFQNDEVLLAADIDSEGIVTQFKPEQIWAMNSYLKNLWNSTEITRDEYDQWLMKVLL